MATQPPGGKPEPLDLTQFNAVEFIENPSMIRPMIGTVVALFAFASAFLLTVVKYLSAKDFVGLWVYLQTDQTAAGLAQISAAGLLVWRLYRRYKSQHKLNRLVDTSPIAVKTTDPVAIPVPTPMGSTVVVVPAAAVPPEVILESQRPAPRAVAREPVTGAQGKDWNAFQ